MSKTFTGSLAAGLSGVIAALAVGAGSAAATPDLSPAVNTTCTYSQVISAMESQDPAAAAQFSASPMSQSYLHRFLDAPPPQRQQMATMLAAIPGNQQYFALLEQVFNTCQNYQ
jgi:hemophore-related protein